MTSPIPNTGPAPRIAVGTSGFSYPGVAGEHLPGETAGEVVPGLLRPGTSTTEVNNTFYRFPHINVAEAWGKEVPAGFAFTLKLSQRVTHIKRLKDVDREMGWFMDGALALGDKLGPVLVQLPPNFQKDTERLDAFLAKHRPAPGSRSSSATRRGTRTRCTTSCGARSALVIVEMEDGDKAPRPRLATGDWSTCACASWSTPTTNCATGPNGSAPRTRHLLLLQARRTRTAAVATPHAPPGPADRTERRRDRRGCRRYFAPRSARRFFAASLCGLSSSALR